MGLFLGDSEPSKIFVGDTPISKVFLGDTQVRPSGGGGWQPGANTLVYLPLNGDVTDPYNNVTYGWGAGNPSYATWDGNVQAGNFVGNNAISLGTSLDFTGGNGEITICYRFTTANRNAEQRCSQNRSGSYFNITGIASQKVRLYCMHTNTSTATNIVGTTTLTNNTKYLYTATIKSNGDIKLYLNGQLENSGTVGNLCSLNGQFGQWIGSGRTGDSEFWRGMIKDFIVEDRIWTDQEVADYYAQTS